MERSVGLADQASFESIRNDLRELFEQVARLRERGGAGGLSQLRARGAVRRRSRGARACAGSLRGKDGRATSAGRASRAPGVPTR
jgi:hypothetical protein